MALTAVIHPLCSLGMYCEVGSAIPYKQAVTECKVSRWHSILVQQLHSAKDVHMQKLQGYHETSAKGTPLTHFKQSKQIQIKSSSCSIASTVPWLNMNSDPVKNCPLKFWKRRNTGLLLVIILSPYHPVASSVTLPSGLKDTAWEHETAEHADRVIPLEHCSHHTRHPAAWRTPAAATNQSTEKKNLLQREQYDVKPRSLQAMVKLCQKPSQDYDDFRSSATNNAIDAMSSGRDLASASLRTHLEDIMLKFSQNAGKLYHLGSSQQNESLNSLIANAVGWE